MSSELTCTKCGEGERLLKSYSGKGAYMALFSGFDLELGLYFTIRETVHFEPGSKCYLYLTLKEALDAFEFKEKVFECT